MKQTAVEWLVNCIESMDWGEITTRKELYDKAKEMEKEQLCFFYIKGAESELNNPYITNIEFYNKQFKQQIR